MQFLQRINNRREIEESRFTFSVLKAVTSSVMLREAQAFNPTKRKPCCAEKEASCLVTPWWGGKQPLASPKHQRKARSSRGIFHRHPRHLHS